ncbi:MAG: transporter permease subunit, partial [Devosia sp.]|nr:transporter permease subunit [Devosia sp.]
MSRTESVVSTPRRRIPWDYLAVAPFVIFAVMFLFMPTLSLIGTAFTDRSGNFTLDNI